MTDSKRIACAICIKDNYNRPDGVAFTANPGITPVTVRGVGIWVCAIHAEPFVSKALASWGPDTDDDTNQILHDVELESRQGMPR